jgi:hypothetical protein
LPGGFAVERRDLRHHRQAAVAGQAHLQRVIRRGQLVDEFLAQDGVGIGGVQVHHFAQHAGEFQRQGLGEIGHGEVRGRKRSIGLQPECSAARGDRGEQRAAGAARLFEIVLGGAGQRV